jgi:hypothetical protein
MRVNGCAQVVQNELHAASWSLARYSTRSNGIPCITASLCLVRDYGDTSGMHGVSVQGPRFCLR